MKRKKQFVVPRVIRVIHVQLEHDLLVRSVELDSDVYTESIENVDTNVADTETYDVFYD